MFDHTQTKCHWNDLNSACEYVPPVIGWRVIIIISVVVAIFTAPINAVVDFTFNEVLSAPTVDTLKVRAQDSAIMRAGRRLSNAVRRASLNAVNAVTAAARFKKVEALTETVIIPESTVTAHSLALASAMNFSDQFKKYTSNLDEMRHQHTRSTILSAAPGSTIQFVDVDTTFENLSREVGIQRRYLRRTELSQFDAQWGLDSEGKFMRGSNLTHWFGWAGDARGAEAQIKKELAIVQRVSSEKIKKLKRAEDSHIGLEMLHEFIIDILGRHSPAARIFEAKTGEEFRHSRVVSKFGKAVCWLIVVVLNCFFVYFAVLRSNQRGGEWQRGYAFACLIQFLVEVFMFETMECVIVHYVIPSSASADIHNVIFTLKCTVDNLCRSALRDQRYFFDAPEYFFVSRAIAKRFPELIESVIVRSYVYYLPGEVGKQWRSSARHANRSKSSFLRNWSVIATATAVLQYLGSGPPVLQRMFIHSIQPITFSAVLVIGMILYRSPIYISIFGVFVLYKLFQNMYRCIWIKDGSFYGARRGNRPMTPSADLGVVPIKESSHIKDSEPCDEDSVTGSVHLNRGRADSSQSLPNESRARTESVNSSDGGGGISRPRRLPSLKGDPSQGNAAALEISSASSLTNIGGRGRADSSQSLPDESRARTESVNSSDGGGGISRPRRLPSLKEDGSRNAGVVSNGISSTSASINVLTNVASASFRFNNDSKSVLEKPSAAAVRLKSNQDLIVEEQSYKPEVGDSKSGGEFANTRESYESSELSSSSSQSSSSSSDMSDSDFDSSSVSSDSSTDFSSVDETAIDSNTDAAVSQNRKILFLKKNSPKT
jgi:hypothetical protein